MLLKRYLTNTKANDVVKAEFEALRGTATPTIVVNNDKAFVGPNAAAELIAYLNEQIAQ